MQWFGYCPEYAFHASDEFQWFLPRFANYSWTAADRAFSRRVNERLGSLIVNGSVPSWRRFTDAPHAAPHDRLPPQYRAIDLASPDRVVPRLKAAECAFWLEHGFYETRGLIN